MGVDPDSILLHGSQTRSRDSAGTQIPVVVDAFKNCHGLDTLNVHHTLDNR